MMCVKQLFQKYGKRVMTIYVAVFLLIIAILLISFSVIISISDASIVAQAESSLSIIVQQAKDQLIRMESDYKNIYYNMAQDEAVLDFLRPAEKIDRWNSLQTIQAVVAINRRMNSNIENIIMYDENGGIIFSDGNVFFEKPDMELSRMMNYSGAITDPTGRIFYQVGMPVYRQGVSGYQFQGSIYLLCNVEKLQEIADGALFSKDSAIAIVTQTNELLAYSGNWQDSYLTVDEQEKNLLVQRENVGTTGWTFIMVIPESALAAGNDQLNLFLQVVFVLVLILLFLLCVVLYRGIIAPVSRQTAFIASYPQHTRRRLKNLPNNEIGEMGRSLNQMLDTMEALNREIVESKKQYLELEYAKKQTEMIAYRSQINPHFLYNTFDCIRGMALYHDLPEIAEITTALANCFRYSVRSNDIVTVHDEIENLRQYQKIIQHRFNGKYHFSVVMEDGCEDIQMPSMLLQPLVENAVFHGLEPRNKDGWICVNVCSTGDMLSICIEDKGKGMSPETLESMRASMRYYDQNAIIPDKHEGIGFMNVYRRLKLFCKDAARMDIHSTLNQGTTITMMIPKKRG